MSRVLLAQVSRGLSRKLSGIAVVVLLPLWLILSGAAQAATASSSPGSPQDVAPYALGPITGPQNQALQNAETPASLMAATAILSQASSAFAQGRIPSNMPGTSAAPGAYTDPILTGSAAAAARAVQQSHAAAVTPTPDQRAGAPGPSSAASLGSAATPALEPAGVFGIADEHLASYLCSPVAPPSSTTCGPGTTNSASNESIFYAGLAAGLSLGYARINVPYDMLATYNPSTGQCIASFAKDGGVAWSDVLSGWLTAVKAAGLTPLIGIDTFYGDTSDGYTYQGVNHYDARDPSMTVTTQEDSYICGVAWLMLDTTAAGLPVSQWEPWNEPDLNYPPSGTTAATRAANAYDEYVLTDIIDADLGRSDTLVAGTFSGALNSDIAPGDIEPDYISDITSAGLYPAVWSMHDYHDVQNSNGCTGPGSGGCSSTELIAELNLIDVSYEKSSRALPQMWITETGVWLEGLYGANVNASPTHEADAAEGFLQLYNASCCQLSRVYYYDFEASAGDTFDSALIAPDGHSPPDGDRGFAAVLRPGYCVLVDGYTPAVAVSTPACNDSTAPTADSDWENPQSPYYDPLDPYY